MPKVMAMPEGPSRGRRGRRVSTTLAEVNLPVARQTQKMSEERVYITVPLSYQKDSRVFLDEEAVSLDFLAERIRQAMISKDQKEVFLRPDGGVRMQEVLDVMDRLKEGGIERVGIVALQRAPR
jgi:biopolymer transport protein ExbD